jgi:hypothetical protein
LNTDDETSRYEDRRYNSKSKEKPSQPISRSENKWCSFHKSRFHDSKDCFSLKNKEYLKDKPSKEQKSLLIKERTEITSEIYYQQVLIMLTQLLS